MCGKLRKQMETKTTALHRRDLHIRGSTPINCQYPSQQAPLDICPQYLKKFVCGKVEMLKSLRLEFQMSVRKFCPADMSIL